MCIPPDGVRTRRVSGNGPSCASVPSPSTLLWASPVSTSITTKPQPQSNAIQAFGHSVHHVMIVSPSQLAAIGQFRMREILSDRHGITCKPRPAYCRAISSIGFAPVAVEKPASPVATDLPFRTGQKVIDLIHMRLDGGVLDR